MEPRSDNLRAWIWSAPATAAMVAFNIAPACRALIDDPPRPLMAELGGWAISSLVVVAQALAVCGPILLVEVPLALAFAVFLSRRQDQRPAAVPLGTTLAAILAGLAWRLLFGGSIGFAGGDAPRWWTVGFEVWRSLPIAVLILYAPLRRVGAALGEAALLDGADFLQTVRRVYLPLCGPAIALLAALHVIDYLRAAQTPLISVAGADRAIWTLLVVVVATLALRVAARPPTTE